MTVEDLISKLEKLPNKKLKVYSIPDNGDPEEVTCVSSRLKENTDNCGDLCELEDGTEIAVICVGN